MHTNEAPNGYSVKEFTQRWGIGRNTFYKELANGDLVTIKVGRRRLVTQRAEREWIKAKEKQGGLR
jgi:excisionase family DNA binding protein